MGLRGQGKGRHRSLATIAAIVGVVPFAMAQVSDGGRSLQLTLGQTLEYSDNIDLVTDPQEDTLRSTTGFVLRYRDITRTQRLEVELDGDYEVDNTGGTELSDPFARLTYQRDNENTRFRFSADYRRTDLDDVSIPLSLLLPGVALPDRIVNDVAQIETGLRTDTSYELNFETGMQSALGFRLELFARDRRYDDLQIFDLAENIIKRGEVETTLRINPAMTARVFASLRRFESENDAQTVRTDEIFGAGLIYEVSPATQIDLFLGHEEIDRTQNEVRSIADGPRLTFDMTRSMPNGAIELSAASRPTLNGRDSTLRVTRDMDLRRGGELSYGIGASRTGNIGTEPLLTLSYIQPLKRGRFALELGQEARSAESNDEPVILSRLSLGYAVALTPRVNFSVRAGVDDFSSRVQDEERRSLNLRSDLSGRITEISSWSIGASVTDTDVFEQGVETRDQRYGLQIAYRRQITPDWEMVAQYQHSAILNSAEEDRRSNTISFGLERTFDTRF